MSYIHRIIGKKAVSESFSGGYSSSVAPSVRRSPRWLQTPHGGTEGKSMIGPRVKATDRKMKLGLTPVVPCGWLVPPAGCPVWNPVQFVVKRVTLTFLLAALIHSSAVLYHLDFARRIHLTKIPNRTLALRIQHVNLAQRSPHGLQFALNHKRPGKCRPETSTWLTMVC